MQEKTLWKYASQALGSYFVSCIYGGAFPVKTQKLLKDLEIPMNSKHTQFFPKPVIQASTWTYLPNSNWRKQEEEK